jgi:hypothetical protein
MVLCRESARPAIAVKFDNQHALGISRHLHGAIGAEVVSLIGLHSALPGLLRFTRNDISTRSEFQARSSVPSLHFSNLSASLAPGLGPSMGASALFEQLKLTRLGELDRR